MDRVPTPLLESLLSTIKSIESRFDKISIIDPDRKISIIDPDKRGRQYIKGIIVGPSTRQNTTKEGCRESCQTPCGNQEPSKRLVSTCSTCLSDLPV